MKRKWYHVTLSYPLAALGSSDGLTIDEWIADDVEFDLGVVPGSVKVTWVKPRPSSSASGIDFYAIGWAETT